MRMFFKIATFFSLIFLPLSEICAQNADSLLTRKIEDVGDITYELIKLKDSLEYEYEYREMENPLLKSALAIVQDFKDLDFYIKSDTLHADKKIEMLDLYGQNALTLTTLLKESVKLDLPLIVDYEKYKRSTYKTDYCISKSEYILKQSQINYESDFLYTVFKRWDGVIARVVNKDGETKVDYAMYIDKSPQGLSISENTFLKDTETGTLYKIRRVDKAIPLANLLVFKGNKDECISITLVFPPLDKGVEELELLTFRSDINADNRYELTLEKPVIFKLKDKLHNPLPLGRIVE